MFKDKVKNQTKEHSTKKKKVLFLITFFTTVLLTVSTYAWLSSALNVKIHFFEMSVSSNTGIFISLDGVEFSDSVTISMDSIIMDLKSTYPSHTNQWSYGLWPVSSNGPRTVDNDKFDIFTGELVRTKEKNANGTVKRLLNTINFDEKVSRSATNFVAFDIFLKNVSGSPFPDNLYIADDTFIDYEEETDDEVKYEMDGIINSLRLGIIKIGSVPLKSDINTIQNIKCNNACEAIIYEPNYLKHSEKSIETAENYGIKLKDGIFNPTYGIINEGTRLEHTNGHDGTGIPLDSKNFKFQDTIKDFKSVIFQVPNAITKARVYIWLEGQDIDSLETYSRGADLAVSVSLTKDLAGYE